MKGCLLLDRETMSVENTEDGLTKNRKLRNFDAALEDSELIRMVVSDASTGKVVAALWDDGAVEEAERLANNHGFLDGTARR